jgi:hypothetical protein
VGDLANGPPCLQDDKKIEINSLGGLIIHVADVHGGSKVLGAVLKASCMDTNVVPVAVDATEVQHQRELDKRRQADRKRKAAGASSSHPHPFKRVKPSPPQQVCFSDDSEWEVRSPDPHVDEEFWVEGRE